MSRRLLLFGLICALALVLGFWSFTPHQAVSLVRHYGYWSVLASVLAFSIAVVRSLRGEAVRIQAWRSWWRPVAVALGAAVFLHLHERHEFKIVADEVVLQLTAKQLHEAREASVVVRGYDFAGNFSPMGSYVDKRPLVFPFLLSLLHDVTGFRPGNVHVLNAVLSGVLMLLLVLIGRRLDSWSAGVAAVLLMATMPLLAQNAVGSGFELLNLVMIAAVVWLGLRAGEQPRNADRLSAFVLGGVVLAQVRYESALFVLPVGAAVAYLWWRERELWLPWGLFLAPLLLVICPLHYNVFKISEAAWQLEDVAGAERPFALGYFYDNVGHALNFLLSTDGSQGNSLLIAALGALSLGFFILLLYRRHREIFSRQPGLAVFSILLLGLMAHTFLMLCYFWGKWDDPIIRRLSLPAHVLFVLATVMIWPSLISHRHRWRILAGLSLAYGLSFTIPQTAMHRYTQENFAARTTNWLVGYLEQWKDRSILAIDHNAGLLWFLYEKSSIGPGVLVQRPEAFYFHFRNRSFQDYLIVQRVTPNPATGERSISFGDDFGDALTLELIEERSFAPLYLVRLSRVVAVDEAKLLALAGERQKLSLATVRNSPALTPEQNDEVLLWLRQLP